MFTGEFLANGEPFLAVTGAFLVAELTFLGILDWFHLRCWAWFLVPSCGERNPYEGSQSEPCLKQELKWEKNPLEMFKMLPCNPGRSTHSLLRTSEPWSINPPTRPTPVLIYTLRTIRPASGRQMIRLRPLIINRGSCWFYGFPEQILEICIFFIQSPNINKPINLIPTIHPTIRPSLFVSIHSYPSLRA